jgi:hypothetical protein
MEDKDTSQGLSRPSSVPQSANADGVSPQSPVPQRLGVPPILETQSENESDAERTSGEKFGDFGLHGVTPAPQVFSVPRVAVGTKITSPPTPESTHGLVSGTEYQPVRPRSFQGRKSSASPVVCGVGEWDNKWWKTWLPRAALRGNRPSLPRGYGAVGNQRVMGERPDAGRCLRRTLFGFISNLPRR